MTSNYKEVPDNFNDINAYLISEIEEIKELFYKYEVKCFYDTCAILHHSNIREKSILLEFLLERYGLLIVTRTVLMELAGEQHLINHIQVKYFKELHEVGLKIILLNEEDSIILLREAIDLTNEKSNQLLGYAIKKIMTSRKAISNLMASINNNLKRKLLGSNSGNSLLHELFFNYARENKVSGDSLAEELIFISIIILTKMPLGKYIFLSNDLASMKTVQDIREYIKKYHNMDSPKMLTTSKIVEVLFKENICTDKNRLMHILQSTFYDNVSAFCIGEDDLMVVYKSFSKEEFIQKLRDKNFHVVV